MVGDFGLDCWNDCLLHREVLLWVKLPEDSFTETQSFIVSGTVH